MLAPVSVVAVLLAAPRIAAGSLQVAIGQRADPDIGVSRWNGQPLDAPNVFSIGEPAALCIAKSENARAAEPG